jgi:serine/threonine-protein kinase
MSDVWSATDLVLGRAVAVKVILPALLTRPGFGQRFRSEAQILAGLRHPGIVIVYDYGQVSGPAGEIAYLVMELVHGQPLSERLAAVSPLGVDDTMSIVAQAADALQAAHEAGVVHRDVKPGNLLLRPDGTVTLVDFGVATAPASAGLTGPNEVPGTALYMAPEQVAGREAAPSVDVYALGVVAYECLSGGPPFTAPTALAVAMRHVHDAPPPLPPEVPPAARAVVDRALAKDPADRFPSAAALAVAARAVGTPGTEEIAVSGAAATTVAQPALRPAGPLATAVLTPARGPRRRTAALLSAAIAGITAILALPAFMDREQTPTPYRDMPVSVVPAQTTADAGRSSQAGSEPSSSRPGGTPAATTRGPSIRPTATDGRSTGPTAAPSRSTVSPAPSTTGPTEPQTATPATTSQPVTSPTSAPVEPTDAAQRSP